MKYNVNTIEDYLNVVPKERRPVIDEIIAIIDEIAPKATKIYKYNMPYYALFGEPLFAVASQKHFIAVYITEHKLIEKYKAVLGKVSLGKSCIRFTKKENVDFDALTKLLIESYDKRVLYNVPHSAS